ncbi:TraV family lipoprotein [Nitrosophilus labii]|uniref:TraV family lipoprotein n=1 Tax=Nitrosophilus labii TaxID=2706014 RepID=UPI001657437E|nr:TraV family lipoprotein [Nitrosophilus labii]
MKKNAVMMSMLIATMLLTGCASTSNNITIPAPKKEQKNKLSNNEKMAVIREFAGQSTPESVEKKLLKTSPVYAQKHKKDAVIENMKVKENMPLYRQPLFAKMIIYPYVSKSGIYHGYQTSYIKIKEGEWVLADQGSDKKDEKIFDFNEVK